MQACRLEVHHQVYKSMLFFIHFMPVGQWHTCMLEISLFSFKWRVLSAQICTLWLLCHVFHAFCMLARRCRLVRIHSFWACFDMLYVCETCTGRVRFCQQCYMIHTSISRNKHAWLGGCHSVMLLVCCRRCVGCLSPARLYAVGHLVLPC